MTYPAVVKGTLWVVVRGRGVLTRGTVGASRLRWAAVLRAAAKGKDSGAMTRGRVGLC